MFQTISITIATIIRMYKFTEKIKLHNTIKQMVYLLYRDNT